MSYRIVNKLDKASAWKIKSVQKERQESYWIKGKLDQSRIVKTEEHFLTIYVDSIEEDQKYRGSQEMVITGFDEESEIDGKINRAIIAAKEAKAPWYPLAQQSPQLPTKTNSFDRFPLNYWQETLGDILNKAEVSQRVWINSSEIHLGKNKVRLTNSQGLDIEYTYYRGMIDLVVTAKGADDREYELHKEIRFSDFEPEILKSQIQHTLQLAQDRAKATSLPRNLDCPVILTGTTVRDFFSYYHFQCTGKMDYQGMTSLKTGDSVYGEGDKLTLKVLPMLYNSPYSAPVDNDGLPFRELCLIQDGVIKTKGYNLQYSHYAQEPPTPLSPNFTVAPGSVETPDLKGHAYLEIVSFSDFDMDHLAGNFGGEIRLGYYYDGEKRVPVTGGSISGNVLETQKSFRFSVTMMTLENYEGPAYILLKDASISGVS